MKFRQDQGIIIEQGVNDYYHICTGRAVKVLIGKLSCIDVRDYCLIRSECYECFQGIGFACEPYFIGAECVLHFHLSCMVAYVPDDCITGWGR